MAIIKTNHAGFVYDSNSNVVINTNESELRSYRNQVAAEKRVQDMERRYDEIASKINVMFERFNTERLP